MASSSSSDASASAGLAVRVTLPDGKVLELPSGATGHDAAAAIGPGLAKAALAAVVDGEMVDLHRPLPGDCSLRLITERDPEAPDLLRHSAAHVLATAVRRLRPGAQIGFGPSIEDGFYYDFGVDAPFTPEDLERFEQEMAEVIEADYAFERQVVSKSEARELFRDDPLKLERLEEFSDDEVITVYRDGPFLDLCRGPHVPSTGRLKHFRLLSAAGAYWRGDERRQMLQRIYGTAFFRKPTSRSTSSGSRRRRSATTGSWGASSTSYRRCPTGSAPDSSSGSPRAPWSATRSRTTRRS
jgi:threonyl-tRNA synthetase